MCDLFARNHPQGWRLGGEKLALPKVLKGRFDFRNCRRSMQVHDTAKAVSQQPLPPGERETAPSLGVRLVNAGRKREEKPVKSNRTAELAGKAAIPINGYTWIRQLKVYRGVVMQNQPNPDDRLAQNGNGLKVCQAQC